MPMDGGPGENMEPMKVPTGSITAAPPTLVPTLSMTIPPPTLVPTLSMTMPPTGSATKPTFGDDCMKPRGAKAEDTSAYVQDGPHNFPPTDSVQSSYAQSAASTGPPLDTWNRREFEPPQPEALQFMEQLGQLMGHPMMQQPMGMPPPPMHMHPAMMNPWMMPPMLGGYPSYDPSMLADPATYFQNMADYFKNTPTASSSAEYPQQQQQQGKSRGKGKKDPAKPPKKEKVDNTPEDQKTTVMLKNIPDNYDRDRLVQVLNTQGFHTNYDFAYLPFDFKTTKRLGYAFVNLVDHITAVRFMTHFDGFKDDGFDDDDNRKIQYGEVAWGYDHGRESHMEKYKDSPLMHKDVDKKYKPMIFDKHGNQEAWPEARKGVQAPRQVQRKKREPQ